MRIYVYDSITGEYLGEETATVDAEYGEPVVPAFATLEKPPKPAANAKVVFKDGSWKYEFNGEIHDTTDWAKYVKTKEYKAEVLQNARVKAIDEINAKFSLHFASEYPHEEQLTFNIQLEEALDYLKQMPEGERVPAMLEAMADERGMHPKDLALKIVGKDIDFRNRIGRVVGLRHKLIDKIKKAKTLAELEKITL